MDDDGHPVAIGRAEHAPELLDVLRVVVVHTGIAEVHLHAVSKVRVLRASRELGERVILQRIDAAEPDEAIGVFRHLLAGPVIVRPQPLGGIVDLSRPLLPDVGRRKHHRALDAGGIEQGITSAAPIGVVGAVGGAGEISAASAGLNRGW